MKHEICGAALAVTMLGSSLPTYSFEIADLSKAVSEGKAALDFRYRFEGVDQDPIDDAAQASTLRSRFTWSSAAVNQFSVGVEADYITTVGSDDYNSTENGNTEYPIVADPEGFDLNQAFLKYAADAATLTGGRQRILHGDQRFVGGVAWRQNEQTFDAARAEISPLEGLSLDYAYIWNVNRIFGPDDGAQPGDWQGDTHVLSTRYTIAERHSVQAFAYLLDFENDNGPLNSSATYGIGYTGTFGILSLNAAVATQSDYADSPLDYDAPYYAVSTALALKPVTISLGYEVLGSDDGLAAFSTPLATLHKFQGWADKFLITPEEGIEDLYAGLATTFGPIKLALVYHDFSANEGGADYGDEIDAVASYAVHEKVSLELKYANYNADEFASDTTKAWLSVVFTL